MFSDQSDQSDQSETHPRKRTSDQSDQSEPTKKGLKFSFLFSCTIHSKFLSL